MDTTQIPTPAQPVMTTPPPPTQMITPENYGALWSERDKLKNEVESLKAQIETTKTEYETKISENAEKLATFEALTAERDTLTASLAKYKEHVSSQLVAQHATLDELIKEDINLENYKDNPLNGLSDMAKISAQFKALQDRIKPPEEDPKGENLKGGDPKKDAKPEDGLLKFSSHAEAVDIARGLINEKKGTLVPVT